MADVRSKPLAHVIGAPAATTLLYTVPPGETALVKWAQVYNDHTAALTLGMWVDYGAGNGRIFRMSIPTITSIQIPLWWALSEGMTISTSSSTGSLLNVHLFGAELEGVAD